MSTAEYNREIHKKKYEKFQLQNLFEQNYFFSFFPHYIMCIQL